MGNVTELGTHQVIEGVRRVYFHGYWIKAYDVPEDTLLTKKRLIVALTRRLFNHVEHGLNVPGTRLDEARASFDQELDPATKRVKGAMLAGALFNRATDIFNNLVEVQAMGVVIEPDNALMRVCGEHLQEALSLGKMVRHRSGDEGIDELWGEPLKAFLLPVHDFYRSRYIKISQTMAAIDSVCTELRKALDCNPRFAGIGHKIDQFGTAAKVKSETLRTDSATFDVSANFVVSKEALAAFEPHLNVEEDETRLAEQGRSLLRDGLALVSYICRARVPMPTSTARYIDRCHTYRSACAASDRPSMRVPVA